jgi:hypothetical protein
MADEIASDAAEVRWTVRGVPKRYRDVAAEAAVRADLSVGAWLCRAIEQAVQAERAPLEVTAPAAAPAPRPAAAGVGELADLMRAAQAMAEATGVPIPKATARHAVALMTGELRAARGLPPLAPRRSAQRQPARAIAAPDPAVLDK